MGKLEKRVVARVIRLFNCRWRAGWLDAQEFNRWAAHTLRGKIPYDTPQLYEGIVEAMQGHGWYQASHPEAGMGAWFKGPFRIAAQRRIDLP